MLMRLWYIILFFPLYGYSVGNTINYVWVPATGSTLAPISLITSDGQRTGITTFPSTRGTAGFNHVIYDCNVSNWSGLWNKQTYTYMSIPLRFSSVIGEVTLRTTYNDATYQWNEDGKSVAYWQTSLVNNQTLYNACATQGGMGVMDMYWGGAKIEVTVPTLPWAGELTLNIPFNVANMEHWWNITQGGDPNWEYGYSDFKNLMTMPWYIPVSVKAFSACKLSTQNLNINHGVINSSAAFQGHSASGLIDVTCSYPANLKVTVMNSITNDDNNVSCGSGVCTLTVNGKKSLIIEKVSNGRIKVDSLFKSAIAQTGLVTGHAILRIDIA
ncbi:TPA: hypothetical protein ACXZU9_003588 [Salmonella enterica]